MIKQFGVSFKAELTTKLKEKLKESHRMKSTAVIKSTPLTYTIRRPD